MALSAKTLKLIRTASTKYSVMDVYNRGLVWAISNKGKSDVLAVYTYCNTIVKDGEYDFDEFTLARIRKLIVLMVADKKVFNPSYEHGYSQIAFAMGVVDGVDLYEQIEEMSASRYPDLMSLLECDEDEEESDCASEAPTHADPDLSIESLLEAVDQLDQGSVQ